MIVLLALAAIGVLALLTWLWMASRGQQAGLSTTKPPHTVRVEGKAGALEELKPTPEELPPTLEHPLVHSASPANASESALVCEPTDAATSLSSPAPSPISPEADTPPATVEGVASLDDATTSQALSEDAESVNAAAAASAKKASDSAGEPAPQGEVTDTPTVPHLDGPQAPIGTLKEQFVRDQIRESLDQLPVESGTAPRHQQPTDGPAAPQESLPMGLCPPTLPGIVNPTPNQLPPDLYGSTSEPSDNTTTAVPTSAEPFEKIREPRKYRPGPRGDRGTRPSGSRKTERVGLAEGRALPISVRLRFERAGYCSLTLLPRRNPDLPTEIEVTGTGTSSSLLALQDDWCQDVITSNLGDLLRSGVEWVGDDEGRTRWSLAGRDLFVLAPHRSLSGFVSTARLIIGERHVVLCTEARFQDVKAALDVARCDSYLAIPSDKGLPAGWLGFRDVVPTVAVPTSGDGDILDVLRPSPDIEIVLEGGIRIDRQAWLAGYPPRIRLLGQAHEPATVTIDGTEASLDDQGGFVAEGWDTVGAHSVHCAAGTRSYSIREGIEEWGLWEAYQWHENTGSRHPSVCGALVQPASGVIAHRTVSVPSSSPVLLGAVPGEMHLCRVRSDVRSEVSVGFPDFDPVWAVPIDALRANRSETRIVYLGAPYPPAVNAAKKQSDPQRDALRAWCTAVRNAGSKGLPIDPTSPDVLGLWREYTNAARSLRRYLS